MIIIATCFMCFPIVAHWIEHRRDLKLIRVPMGDRAPEGLRAFSDPPDLLMSVGFSGGLTEGGQVGEIVLASSIEYGAERIALDDEVLGRAKSLLEGADVEFSVGHTICADRIVGGAEGKAELGATGAISVDMESGSLARWARNRSVDFLSLRVVLDPVDREIYFSESDPTWRTVLRHPGATLWTARAARAAARALGPAVNRLVRDWEAPS